MNTYKCNLKKNYYSSQSLYKSSSYYYFIYIDNIFFIDFLKKIDKIFNSIYYILSML